MRLGMSLTTNYTDYTDHRLAARHAVERAAAAARSELDSLFVGDHHASGMPYLQNVPMLARMLAEWGDAPAGCLFLLPLWNPVLLAEQVGTLACLQNGRFIVQAGVGTGNQQFAAMGTTAKTRPSAFEESLSICRRLWAGETVSSEGRFRFAAARISPRPPEPPEVWHACSVAGMERAARLGDGWLGGPGTALDDARREVDTYLACCEEAGRRPTAIALRRDVYVGATSAQAREVRERAIAAGYRGFAPDVLVAGSVEEAAEQLAPFAALGVTDICCRHFTNDQSLVLGSMERLAEVRRLVAPLV
jgi:alkanesulfonate monooxygenase SsuD/methylene tetrahydromethanopterin reductase-like flavin-dependent oxidoreductase (luciferase family)